MEPTQPITPPLQDPAVQTSAKPPATKLILIIVGAAIALLLLASAGLWWWSTTASSQYAKSADTYTQTLKDAYHASEPTFLDVQGADTAKDKVTFLQKAQKQLQDALNTKPAEPKVLWVSVAPANKVAQVNNQTQAINKIVGTVQTVISFIAYENAQQEVINSINKYQILTTANANAYATNWSDATKKIKTIKPPSDALPIYADLIKAFDATDKLLHEIVTAKDANDTTTYNQKLTQLKTVIVTVNPPFQKLLELLQQDVNKIYKTYNEQETLFAH